MPIQLSDIPDWFQPVVWYSSVMTRVAAGELLDFSGVTGINRASVEGVLSSLKNFGLDEDTLRKRLGETTMTEEIRRAVLPIFNLRLPVLEETAGLTNNPFAQLEAIQQTYKQYVETFAQPQSTSIRDWLESEVKKGTLLWREPFLQVRRRYKRGASLNELIARGWLPARAKRVFRLDPEDFEDSRPIHPHWHQEEALRLAQAGKNFVVATGTGSGKSFGFGLPIVSYALEHGTGSENSRPGIKAVILYPMNALANSQYQDFAQRLNGTGLRIALYTGDTPESPEEGENLRNQTTMLRKISDAEMWSRRAIRANPPDILMTNYAQLELLLTRRDDVTLFPPEHRGTLRYLVLDEVHTYAGRRGAEVALLIRRLKQHTGTVGTLQCIGTSATVDSSDSKTAISKFATELFGERVEDVIGEEFAPRGEVSDKFLPPKIGVTSEDLERFTGQEDAFFDLAAKALGVPLQGVARSPENLGSLVADYAPLHFVEETLYQGPQRLEDIASAYRERYRPKATLEAATLEVKAAILLGQVAEVEREGSNEPRLVLKLHAFYSQGLGVVSTLDPKPALSSKGESRLEVDGQSRVAFPVVFCRACGQEYLSAQVSGEAAVPYTPFEGLQAGSGYLRPGRWDDTQEPLPDGWLTPKTGSVQKKYLELQPHNFNLDPISGFILAPEATGVAFTFLPAPFNWLPDGGVPWHEAQTCVHRLVPLPSVGVIAIPIDGALLPAALVAVTAQV